MLKRMSFVPAFLRSPDPADAVETCRDALIDKMHCYLEFSRLCNPAEGGEEDNSSISTREGLMEQAKACPAGLRRALLDQEFVLSLAAAPLVMDMMRSELLESTEGLQKSCSLAAESPFSSFVLK